MSDHCFEGFQDFLNASSSQDQHESREGSQKPFDSLEEARSLLSKSYSLEPDMLHGWVPKIPSIPMPLYYGKSLEAIKSIIRRNQTYKIVYEWKNTKYNTVKLHQKYNYSWQKRNQFEIKWGFLEEAVQTIGKPKDTNMCAQTLNECPKDQYKFDSDFQSGNLQLAIRVRPDEYDCFLRSDSNTAGHTNWYYFTVQNFSNLGPIKINICNLRKTKNLYGKGMAPYVKLEGIDEWSQQSCEQINFVERYCRYQQNVKSHILQFQYKFTAPNQMLHVAYCIPYTYSQLQTFIKEIQANKNVQCSSLGQSFSSLTIPLLKITNTSKPIVRKRTVLMIGRTHPGESNSSWVVQGVIKELLSETNFSKTLRQKFQFWIIPMLSVDGVVLGNFRCGGQGTDFNRCFAQEICSKTIEVKHVIDLVKILKSRGNKLQFVIDFHGHSAKQNCFFYGPQFHTSNQYYTKSRLFTKIFQQKCPSFDYKSSNFFIPSYKKTTARSQMNTVQKIPMVFTLEVSNGVYEVNKQRKQYNRSDFESIGRDLLRAMYDYNKIEDSIGDKLKLIEMKKRIDWMGRNRSSFRLMGSKQRYSVKRSQGRLNESQQIGKKRKAIKRTSLNLETQFYPQGKDNLKNSQDFLMQEKILAMIEQVSLEKQKDLRIEASQQSDFESEQDDLNEVQQKQMAEEVQAWTNQLARKSVSSSIDKNLQAKKSFYVASSKENKLMKKTLKRQSFMKSCKLKEQQKHFNQKQQKYFNLTNEKFQNQLRSSEKNLTKVLKKTFKPYISNSKSHKILEKASFVQSRQPSQGDKKESWASTNTELIQKQNFMSISFQKQNPTKNLSQKWAQSVSITVPYQEYNHEKHFPLSIKLSAHQKPQQPIKMAKSSIWSNKNIKNLLRSNRFPFILQKFA